MYSKNDIELLKKQLAICYGNYISLLARETGLSRPTVYRFFNGEGVYPANKATLFRAGCQLVSKQVRQERALTRNLRTFDKNDK